MTEGGGAVRNRRLLTCHRLRDAREDGNLPLVLLHGFPFDSRMWHLLAAELPDDRDVVAIDLPGLGFSAGVDLPEPALEASADAVAEALDDAGVRRGVVAGLSMGGYVALALVERHVSLVAGLGLVDTKSTADAPAARANRLRVADAVLASGTVDEVRPMSRALLGETSRAERPELVGLLDSWIGDQPPAGVAWSQRAMAARPDRTAVLQGYGGPSAVVVGAQDEVTPLADAEHLTSTLRAGDPHVVPGAGHMSAFEQPAHVARVLAELAARADAAAG